MLIGKEDIIAQESCCKDERSEKTRAPTVGVPVLYERHYFN